MKCPFKKTIDIYSTQHCEHFGYCDESDCMAFITKSDNTTGCAFIEKYKLIATQGEKCYDLGNPSKLENICDEIW